MHIAFSLFTHFSILTHIEKHPWREEERFPIVCKKSVETILEAGEVAIIVRGNSMSSIPETFWDMTYFRKSKDSLWLEFRVYVGRTEDQLTGTNSAAFLRDRTLVMFLNLRLGVLRYWVRDISYS